MGTCELAHRESGGIKIVWILFRHHVGGGGEELAKERATWAGYSEVLSTHPETLRAVHKYQTRLAEQVLAKHLLGWQVGTSVAMSITVLHQLHRLETMTAQHQGQLSRDHRGIQRRVHPVAHGSLGGCVC